MKKLLLSLLLLTGCGPQANPDPQVAAWEARAQGITITRDEWGIPHIRGETDADAIFGLMYAQAEDDFNRIEENFLFSQGRLGEAHGEEEIWADLRMKLFIDPVEMQAMYEESPQWLKELMDAWADGLNYFLHTHPEVQPRVLTRFEPWMALTFSEGSIGGDIERVNLRQLEAFYDGDPRAELAASGDQSHHPHGARRFAAGGPGDSEALSGDLPRQPANSVKPAAALADQEGEPFEPTGSNGIAIAPEITENGNALLLINPHTSFFFRHEAHVSSQEGLNAYGALTWGQFFVYQGFNETAGWMHTSSSVDNIDEFLETVVERDGDLFYRYGDEERPVEVKEVTVRYRTDEGMAERDFTVYRTHHGPIVREVNGRWVAMALMEEPMNALIQSYSRTKARNLDEYLGVMERHTNSSNNTLFADAEGNIAYLHSNFIPVRDTRFDYRFPVDGSDPATDWHGVHSIQESPNVINPANGWTFCTNNWPYSAAGPGNSPRQEDYPAYMDSGSENFRGIHATMVLSGRSDFTLEGLRQAAYDSYLTGFEELVPAVLEAYDRTPASNPLKARLQGPAQTLRAWDLRWEVESVPTSLGVFLGEALIPMVRDAARDARMSVYEYMATRASDQQLLEALDAGVRRLEEDFGSWQTPWGEINRFQRLTGDIRQPFNDDAPSIPVGFTSSRWGSLASFGARRYDTKRLYGTSGNSFVAVVEFGERVRARAVTAGGLNHDPASPHFNDQAERYATGDLREVHFYPEDIQAHAERTYHPGG